MKPSWGAGQFPATRDRRRCTVAPNWEACDNGFHFAAILRPCRVSFCQQEIDQCPVRSRRNAGKSVSLEEELQAVFRRPAFEEILSDSFGYEHN